MTMQVNATVVLLPPTMLRECDSFLSVALANEFTVSVPLKEAGISLYGGGFYA